MFYFPARGTEAIRIGGSYHSTSLYCGFEALFSSFKIYSLTLKDKRESHNGGYTGM